MIWEWSAAELSRLERFLRERAICGGALTARRIGDGHSNLTFLVTDGERRVVVRRPPPPPIPPGANDMLREAKLISALSGTNVPVPKVLAVCEAGEVLDVPFYVMSYVEGPVVTTATPPTLSSPEVRRRIGEALIDTLAALHAVDWRALGLAGMGRPEGFNDRHRRRMGRLIANEDGSLPPGFAEIDAWLAANVPPETDATIVHNDYRIGNIVLAPDSSGRIAAVLDWELATLGDPLFDVGYFLASYPVRGKPLTPTEELGTATLEEGFPTREELAARYEKLTGRDLSNLTWYTVLALWKLAILYEHSRRRALAGVGDPYYKDPALVRSFLMAACQAAGLEPVA